MSKAQWQLWVRGARRAQAELQFLNCKNLPHPLGVGQKHLLQLIMDGMLC